MSSLTLLSVLALLAASCSLVLGQQNFFAFPDEQDGFPPQPVPPAPSPPPVSAAPPTARPPVTAAPTATPAPTPTTASPAYLDCLANCPTTQEYNPVCGSDLVSYRNPQRLTCANLCGPRTSGGQAWTPVVVGFRGMCIPPGG